MRIISKFHDYYDSVQAFGQDNSVVFLRNKEELHKDFMKSSMYVGLNSKSNSKSTSFSTYRKDKTIRFYLFAIAFCGKVFRGINAEITISDNFAKQNKYFYSYETFKDFIVDNKVSIPNYKITDIKKYFGQDNSDIEKQLIDNKIVLAYRGYIGYDLKAITNPELHAYDFYTVKNSYEAYQEIDQYISGVIGNTERNTVGVSDKDLAKAKGFNCYSFKKEPSKKRKKKCR